MLQLALFVLGQGRGEQEPPDPGVGLPLILGALLLAAAIFAAILFTFHKRSQASKGGVQPPPGETGHKHPGDPPVESVEPRS